jgi:16S rRNA G1207 methylase RsmC
MRTATSATERLFNLVADVLSAYDFSTAARILDVGGGAGPLLIEMSYAHPALTGCVLDLPRCEVAAWHALLEANLTDGAAFISGDIFEELRAASTRCLHGAVLCGRALG